MFHRSLVLPLALAACSTTGTDTAAQQVAIHHVFDYASAGPARLSIMFSMAWFGIAGTDPQAPAGPDPTYHNWDAGGTPCSIVTPDPRASDSCILLGAHNACLKTGAPQRKIASRRRPETGIWSGTGRDVESEHKLDLMLAMLRRPGCRADDGAKLDAWTMQNNSIKFSSKYVANPGAAADFPYRMMMALYDRADLAGIDNAIIPGFDSTWYFHFGASVGLGKCDGSTGNPRANCLGAVQDDLRDLAVEAKKHSSSLEVGGKPVLFVYTDHYQAQDQNHGGHQPSAAEWASLLDAARTAAGTDFYVIGVSDSAQSFEAFDALAPWVGTSSYVDAAGTSVYTDSYSATLARHAALIAGVGAYPGRLVYGGVVPGFDDWTRNWSGPCQERQMPPDSPRDPALLTAQMDFFRSCKTGAGCTSGHAAYDFRGFIGETWDDWTEGSEFEPDVEGGADRLVRLRGLFGKVFGDAYPDAAGDARLAQHWASYGQARNGNGGAAGNTPATDLSCDASGPAAVELTAPFDDSSIAGRFEVIASETSPQVATAIQVYIDDVLAGSAQGETLDVIVPAGAPLAPGPHRVGVKAWYGAVAGPIVEHAVTVTTDPVAETLPPEGAVTAATVRVIGHDNSAAQNATTMQIYVDGALVTHAAGTSIDTHVALAGAGPHRIGIKAWYPSGANLLTEHAITVGTTAVVQTLPATGTTADSPVFVYGADNSGKPVTALQVYLDDALAYSHAGIAEVATHVVAAPGPHRLAIKAWYGDGSSSLSPTATITVR